MYSKKPSSLISLSVKMKVIPLPCWPAVRYRNFKSSSKLLTLYDLQYTTQCVILSISSSRFFNVAPRLSSSLPFSLYLFLTSYLSLLISPLSLIHVYYRDFLVAINDLESMNSFTIVSDSLLEWKLCLQSNCITLCCEKNPRQFSLHHGTNNCKDETIYMQEVQWFGFF